ncbi:glutathione S-transferase family protein [Belnapia sp. T6]|uniref:Glutathione S-transferase family protein n=1 Tax=Belnapia mucosa TaxID=2804532 RepID=A0ABS1V9N2_9PROT|nr:glutathione S-transferase family protein [Belnapia mucosa]MBL6458396.1 glutathione S-transferase family protein [Belnapia mucosa]
MILVGQYDSPFVRRVAVALRILGLTYEHRPWSTFGDADRLAAINPLRRVPALVLDGGEVLIESAAILDYLDEIAGEARLIAREGQARRTMLRICALATGLCDKLVSLLYEQLLHDKISDLWIARCSAQISDVLAALEAERVACATPFWFGATPGHPDIAVACALRFLAEAHPSLHAPAQRPHLAAHAAACEAMPAFASVVQPFSPPGRASRHGSAHGDATA